MGFTYGKMELFHDLQKVFAKHNVQSITVYEPGTLFFVEADGSLTIRAKATIAAFDTKPGDKPSSKFKLINGGNQKET
ncbi:hypothetical protein GCM10010954_27280 [Halobacillus andaensis]|uniref:Uncharacterized protein n=1 Tax=Halobacillus andaensis TaxID=1176239 RepID=A0A917EWI2_HALAA|nr:hypothetical protein [Halobacillus andaensis]MBP2005686.1 hypothetical protein [Halobacillus andaensis]GGF26767.1 hypothetical protein GCM10010954_27280 [Halobacillus andaensis]